MPTKLRDPRLEIGEDPTPLYGAIFDCLLDPATTTYQATMMEISMALTSHQINRSIDWLFPIHSKRRDNGRVRDNIVQRLRSHRRTVIVATDIMSRGIDENIDIVITRIPIRQESMTTDRESRH